MSAKSSKTVLENNDINATLLDDGGTVRENNIAAHDPSTKPAKSFRNMKIISQFMTMGSEADIYLVRDKGQDKVLKLYRLGLDPKQEVLDRYESISHECPQHVV